MEGSVISTAVEVMWLLQERLAEQKTVRDRMGRW